METFTTILLFLRKTLKMDELLKGNEVKSWKGSVITMLHVPMATFIQRVQIIMRMIITRRSTVAISLSMNTSLFPVHG